jgi:UrcA family protein
MKTRMDERKLHSLQRFKVPLAIAAMCAAATFNASAHAVVTDDTAREKVDYSDLNLTTQRGKDALIRRIQRAADHVCGAPDARLLILSSAYRNCITNATNDALAQVRWP